MKIEVKIEKKHFYILLSILILIFLMIIVYVSNEGDSACGECSWSNLEGIPADFADGVDDGITVEKDPVVSWSDLKTRGMPEDFRDNVDNLTGCNWDGWETIETDVRNQVCNGTCGEGMYCPAGFSQTEIKTTEVNCVSGNLEEMNISQWSLWENCTCNGGCQVY